MTEISTLKHNWRTLAKNLFTLVPHNHRQNLDVILSERLRELVFSLNAKFLLAYSPLPDEPELTPFFRTWLEEGGRLAMPLWLGGTTMKIHEITDLDTQMLPGKKGIPEPGENQPEIHPNDLDLVVTPGRFFSEKRQRLGRGAGCYDTLFAENTLKSVAAAYDFQVVPELPVLDTDAILDIILTPTRILMNTD